MIEVTNRLQKVHMFPTTAQVATYIVHGLKFKVLLRPNTETHLTCLELYGKLYQLHSITHQYAEFTPFYDEKLYTEFFYSDKRSQLWQEIFLLMLRHNAHHTSLKMCVVTREQRIRDYRHAIENLRIVDKAAEDHPVSSAERQGWQRVVNIHKVWFNNQSKEEQFTCMMMGW